MNLEHTSDSDVVRVGGGWRWGYPLGHGLSRGVKHEVCEGKSAVVHSE